MLKWISALAALICLAACSSTPRRSPDSKVRTETLTVASRMVDCVGVGVRRCLVVKEGRSSDWELFYDWIDGFEYEPGYEYVISVYRREIDVPPADGSNLKYVLDRVISRQMKESKNLPDTSRLVEALKEEGID